MIWPLYSHSTHRIHEWPRSCVCVNNACGTSAWCCTSADASTNESTSNKYSRSSNVVYAPTYHTAPRPDGRASSPHEWGLAEGNTHAACPLATPWPKLDEKAVGRPAPAISPHVGPRQGIHTCTPAGHACTSPACGARKPWAMTHKPWFVRCVQRPAHLPTICRRQHLTYVTEPTHAALPSLALQRDAHTGSFVPAGTYAHMHTRARKVASTYRYLFR